jgi:hypothetical protein
LVNLGLKKICTELIKICNDSSLKKPVLTGAAGPFVVRNANVNARMRVHKMVKNGFNSGLPVSPVLKKDKIPKEIKNRHEAQSRP